MNSNSSKKKLYKSIMKDVAKIVKKHLTESEQFTLQDGAYWQLFEMSKVGNVGEYIIFINSNDPGYIPNFHIIDSVSYYNKQTGLWKFHTCLEIQRPKYFHHNSKHKEDKINTHMAIELIEFLSSTKRNSSDTNWQYLINLWNDNNSKINVNPDATIPDYTKVNDPDK